MFSYFHSILFIAFHVYNIGYNGSEFILVMLRLLFQELTMVLLKLHGIHLADAPCDGLSLLVL